MASSDLTRYRDPDSGLLLIPATDYPVELWPAPTAKQMDRLRDLLPPAPAAAQTAAA